MKFIKKIKEGESYLNSFIGYQVVKYRTLDDKDSKSLRLGINLKFWFIKIEFIKI